ncbi:MAG: glucose-6-phosphate dehydrogenase [Spirochaeta sp.]|nr:glucose-6-phosphate dehydrogenase [Spirochaeta sp.]
MSTTTNPVNIVIVGASGDLTRKKLLPALFSLYCNGFLPERFHIVGFARSTMNDKEFRMQVAETLTCRYEPEPSQCDIKVGQFLKRCHYHTGQYDNADDFRALGRRLEGLNGPRANMLMYMAIPPGVFLDTAHSIRQAGLSDEESRDWSRVVIEKPFGRDTESSAELTRALGEIFTEEQTYRIDHYLGKEVIQNLLILRFGNRIFEPIWNRDHIESISISFSEEIGVEGRAGYFDHFGIIRDVMQNHLLQAMALTAMEQPISLNPREIAEEKTKLLRATAPIDMEHTVTGQYEGYLTDPGVPEDSVTETFAATTLYVNTPRWYGVPFQLSAGKALDTQQTEIVIRFRELPYSLFPGVVGNCLRIRVQPNESIELIVNNKVPGMAFASSVVRLTMLYHEEFKTELPEAYERLLLDVLRGDRSLFIPTQELAAAWEVVTPALHRIETERLKPQTYAYGSAGPGGKAPDAPTPHSEEDRGHGG